MNKSELLYGERAASDFVVPSQSIETEVSTVVELPDVDIFYALFEVPMSDVIRRLPASLHPSVPAIMGINFWRVTTSPVGAFNFAYVGLACRTGIKPRHLVFGAWCDNSQAATLLAERYGFACEQAEVYVRESFDRVRGAISVSDQAIIDIRSTLMTPIVGAGAVVKYSPTLTLANVAGSPALVQLEASYSFKRVLRGELASETYNGAQLGDAAIAPSYPIAGTFAVCDVQLLPARFKVDLKTPAENGGASKL